MKLTFITDEVSQDPGAFCRLAEEYRLDAVELRTVWGKQAHELGRGERRDLRRALGGSGLSPCCVATPVFKCPISDDLGPQLDLLRRALEAAADLGAPSVRVFSFWREPRGGGFRRRLAEAFSEAARASAEFGVRLLVENGRRTMHATAGELVELLGLVGPDAAGVLWDPANPVYGGLLKDPLDGDFDRVARRVEHVHVKDPVYLSDGDRRYCRFGDGTLDIPALVTRLRAMDYRGYLSVETHWRPDRFIPPESLDRPGGYDFSEGGYEATGDSLQYLRRLL